MELCLESVHLCLQLRIGSEGCVEIIKLCLKLFDLLFKLGGVNGRYANGKSNSSLTSEEVLGFGRYHLNGDGRADLHSIVNGDGVSAD